MPTPTRMIDKVQYSLQQLESMSGPGQVALYNRVTGENVKKFSDRAAGAKRLWKLGEPGPDRPDGKPAPAPRTPIEAPAPAAKAASKSKPATPKPAAKEAKERKVRQMTFRLQPKGSTFKAHREGTHRAKLIQLLSRQNGATFSECQEACDWDKKTTYEGIRLLHSLLGYGLFSEPMRNGDIRIWLVTTLTDFRERTREAKAKEKDNGASA